MSEDVIGKSDEEYSELKPIAYELIQKIEETIK